MSSHRFGTESCGCLPSGFLAMDHSHRGLEGRLHLAAFGGGNRERLKHEECTYPEAPVRMHSFSVWARIGLTPSPLYPSGLCLFPVISSPSLASTRRRAQPGCSVLGDTKPAAPHARCHPGPSKAPRPAAEWRGQTRTPTPRVTAT